MGPFNVMKNASVQQSLSIERLPFPFCHPERSRGICSSADLSWKNGSTPRKELSSRPEHSVVERSAVLLQLLRKATIGLIRDARRAGIYPASSATNSSNRIMLKKVA